MSTRPKYSPTRGEPCQDCGRRLRLQKDLAADHPNTVPHAAHGLCFNCYRLRKQLGEPFTRYDPPPKPVVIHGLDSSDEQLRSAAVRAQEWLTERRNRGVPTGGLWAA